MTPVCYLDYAAATPLDKRVLDAMLPYMGEQFYNPSSPYAPAVSVRRDYQAAKQAIAASIGAAADELIMTAGATESINLALRSFAGHKVCLATEHDSVLRTVSMGEHTIVAVGPDARVAPGEIARAITEQTQLVSVALANHELGTLQPIPAIAQVVRKVRQARLQAGNQTPIVFHCDASQGFGTVDVHVARLGVDLLTLNAAKLYGPKQVGLLWVRPGVSVQPLVYGGGQEVGLRSGTENVAGVIGFAAAVRLAAKKRKAEVARLSDIRDTMQAQLTQALPQVVFLGSQKHRLANFLHLAVSGVDAERLVFMLEMSGVMVATGSACAANKGTGSAVLAAIGVETGLANGSLRISLGRFNTKQQCIEATKAIIQAVIKEQSRQKASSHV